MSEKRTKYLNRKKAKKLAMKKKLFEKQNQPLRFKMYLDESGNSGLHLFNDDNPFICCGMIIKEKMIVPDSIQNVIDKTGGIGLHGSKLGLNKLEAIAAELLPIYQKVKPFFIVSNIDKRFFVAMKLWDCLFDHVTNPGVNSIHVNLPPLRFILMYKFCSVVYESKIIKDFWSIHTSKGERNYSNMLIELKGYCLSSNLDSRSKKIISNAIDGAFLSEASVFEDGALKEDSPNVASVIMMVRELNYEFENENIELTEVIHDRQEEFGAGISKTFNFARQRQGLWNCNSMLPVVKKANSITSDLKIHNSTCNELDLCDIACFLFMKSNKTNLQGHTLKLYEYFSHNSKLITMNQKELEEIAKNYWREISKIQQSDEQIENLKKEIAELDSEILTRLNSIKK